ncbi:transmembrane protein 79 [Oncorhynchus mykiss]|uniref:Transmembrane protein 79 n=2 Tax=Oncorhynchus mykiss TaxID=8022 RepID=A0A8C7R2J4_ONCMY|nr:transmembrane protein 79 [Oncorhynchus mykiss]
MSVHLNPDEDRAGGPSKTSGSTAAGPQTPGTEQQGLEHRGMEKEQGEEDEKQEAKRETSSAALEPSTLLWLGDREGEKGGVVSESEGAEGDEEEEEEERVAERIGGSTELLEGQESQPESERKAKWRESMPEGERWRDDELEGGQREEMDGSLADDEEEGEEGPVNWMPEKVAQVFTPTVIVRPSSKREEFPLENSRYGEMDTEKRPFLEPQTPTAPPVLYYPQWTEEPDNYTHMCGGSCGDVLKLGLGIGAAAVLFPLLVWGGYALLPFDAPPLDSAPLRLVYTLRCSFFAVIPIMLGVLVQGLARLRYGALTPLYEAKVGEESREVAVHRHYVGDSLSLFLLYFLQLAVMATYISQDLLKMVPLLTIVFAFGRLIYWVCVTLGSSVRGLGFGLSFLPILVMLGANLYFVCSSVSEGAVFDVAPPTTTPPPRQSWWG